MAGKTERQLADSMKKLLTRKTLDRITVRDITDDCGVNRQTFYYHFHDVYDLVEWMFRQAAEMYMTEGPEDMNWQELTERIIRSFLEEKSFIMNTYYSLDRRQLDRFLGQFLTPAVSTMAVNLRDSLEIDISEEDQDMVVRVITYSVIGNLAEWIGSGMPELSQEKRGKLFRIMDGTLEYSLMKFDRSKVWLPEQVKAEERSRRERAAQSGKSAPCGSNEEKEQEE